MITIEQLSKCLPDYAEFSTIVDGAGGMATVFRAIEKKTGRVVAVKVIDLKKLLPHIPLQQAKHQALKEAGKLALLEQIANISHIFDSRCAGKYVLLIMEWINGITLEKYLKYNAPLAPVQAAQIVYAILTTLDQCHRHEVIHRDLKPNNIMIQQSQGQLRCIIIDFGIAKILGNQTTVIFRSPAVYAPPENDIEIHPRGDIFAVGRILHFLLNFDVGRSPQGPAQLVTIIQKATAYCDKRYQNCQQMLNALAKFLADNPQLQNFALSPVPKLKPAILKSHRVIASVIVMVIALVAISSISLSTSPDHLWPTESHTVAHWYFNGDGRDHSGNNHHFQLESRYSHFISAPHSKALRTIAHHLPQGIAKVGGISYPASGKFDLLIDILFFVPESLASAIPIVQQYSAAPINKLPFLLTLTADYNLSFSMYCPSEKKFIYAYANISSHRGSWLAARAGYRYRQSVELCINGKKVATVATDQIPLSADYSWYIGHSCERGIASPAIDELRLTLKPSAAWAQLATVAPWPSRRASIAINYHGKIWLMAGRAKDGYAYHDIWNSNDEGRSWSKSADPPWPPRWKSAAAVYRDKLWLAGGQNGEKRYSDVWCWEGNQWQLRTAAAPWPSRDSHCLVAFGDWLWLLGGWGGQKSLADIWRSQDGKNWQKIQPDHHWSARGSLAATVYNKSLWISGGFDGNITTFNDVWQTTDGKKWTCLTKNAPWARRYFHAMSVINNQLAILAGWTGIQAKNDIWLSNDGRQWHCLTPSAPWAPRSEPGILTTADKNLLVVAGYDTNRIEGYRDIWLWRHDIASNNNYVSKVLRLGN